MGLPSSFISSEYLLLFICIFTYYLIPTMNKQILKLAIPNIISNISVPLLSIADTAIAGRMTSSTSLGAVAAASTLVSFTFWLWGFLRMATTGFTAQAYGRGDEVSQAKQFSVGSFIAIMGGLLIILLTPVLTHFLGLLSDGSPTLLPEARTYLRVAYLGAPAALLLYVYNAWFIGMQNTIIPMVTTIISNILNICFSVLFVYFGEMGVEGIAWGTVVAQYSAVLILLGSAMSRHGYLFRNWQWRDLLSAGEFFSYIHIAKYLLLRTLMLGSINLFFVKIGSQYGATTVSANMLLMQLFLTFSYFMDGFAYAGEALTGRFYGAKDRLNLIAMLRALFRIGLIVALIVSIIYFTLGDNILYLLSDKPDILSHALTSRLYVSLIPLTSFAAFLCDGVFVGLTRSKPMMQAVALAWASFYLCYYATNSLLGEYSLWLSFTLYLGVRSLFSIYCVNTLLKPDRGLI